MRRTTPYPEQLIVNYIFLVEKIMYQIIQRLYSSVIVYLTSTRINYFFIIMLFDLYGLANYFGLLSIKNLCSYKTSSKGFGICFMCR